MSLSKILIDSHKAIAPDNDRDFFQTLAKAELINVKRYSSHGITNVQNLLINEPQLPKIFEADDVQGKSNFHSIRQSLDAVPENKAILSILSKNNSFWSSAVACKQSDWTPGTAPTPCPSTHSSVTRNNTQAASSVVSTEREATMTAARKVSFNIEPFTTPSKTGTDDANWMPAEAVAALSIAEKEEEATLPLALASTRRIVEQFDVAKIFVHGVTKKPLKSLLEAKFAQVVIQNMKKLNYNSIRRTQAYCWGPICEGRSTAIINGDKSGKTLSYLPAILSSIILGEEHNLVSSTQGPIGVIIAKTSREVDRIFSLSKLLTKRVENAQSVPELRIVKAFGEYKLGEKKIELLNGCDLLITSPSCFGRFTKGETFRMFNKDRIKHLIFDGFDTMHDNFHEEIMEILRTCTRGMSQAAYNPQLIVVSNSWFREYASLLKLVEDPLIVIGNYIEAAFYAKCKILINKFGTIEKPTRLVDYLRDELYLSQRTLVVVNSSEECAYLQSFLNRCGITCWEINPKNQHTDYNRLAMNEMPLLLATDAALIDSPISRVQHLIHYSLPPTWGDFSCRFATMFDFLQDYLSRAQLNTDESRATTMVLLDDENHLEVPHLIEFMKTHSLLPVVPQNIEKLVQVSFVNI